MPERQPDRDLYLTARAHPAQRVRSSAQTRRLSSGSLIAMLGEKPPCPTGCSPAGIHPFTRCCQFTPNELVRPLPLNEALLSLAQHDLLAAKWQLVCGFVLRHQHARSIRTEAASMKNDAISYPPRGLSREEAARYIGVGSTLFDEMVADGRMPKPKRINSRAVWDRVALDIAFTSLPDKDSGLQELLERSKRGVEKR